MSGRSIIYALSFGAILMLALTLPDQSTQTNDSKTFTDIIAEHPIPHLEDLAQRSKPGLEQDVSLQAFYDLLKLRTVGTIDAVPVLKQVLKDNLYGTRIHGFAATQALFCMNMPEAHSILQQYIFDDRYNTQLGISYAFHWEMPEPWRSGFIERYHLVNRSDTLRVDLTSDSKTVGGMQTLTITATLTNMSQQPFRLRDDLGVFGDSLYIRSDGGRYIQKYPTSTRCKMRDQWIELQPGATHQYQTALEVTSVDQLYASLRRSLTDGDLWLRENHANAFLIGRPGRFEVMAMLEQTPPTEEMKQRMGFDNAWTGRAVSEPISVLIDPVD